MIYVVAPQENNLAFKITEMKLWESEVEKVVQCAKSLGTVQTIVNTGSISNSKFR